MFKSALQELRVGAQVTGIQSMRDMFNHGHPIFGDDMHSMNATNMFRIIKNDDTFVCNKKDYPEERTTAKSMIFKLMFGGSEYTVALDLGVDIEVGSQFLNAFFDANPGLRENFEEAKKLAVKRGWIELDPITEARYFYPYFDKMKELFNEAISYYPEEYRTFNKEEKEKFKKNLYEKNPGLKDIWKEWGTYKSKLERRALNYRIQALAAKQSKLLMIYLEEDNTSLEEGLRLFVHDEACGIYLEENSKKISEDTINYMVKTGTVFTPDVKATGESAIGDYWIH